MNKIKSKEIINELRLIIESPKCELNFNNHFELLVSVILSAQTTDKRVNEITPILFNKYGDSEKLMNADYLDVYNIIKPLGLAKNKANNIIEMSADLHNRFNDIVPNTIEELTSLKGVGRKTASVVLAVGFNIPALPIDTHLIRMANRLGYSKSNDPIEVEKDYKKYIPKYDWIDAHHLLLLFGRYHCKAINPKCDGCLLRKYCKYSH